MKMGMSLGWIQAGFVHFLATLSQYLIVISVGTCYDNCGTVVSERVVSSTSLCLSESDLMRVGSSWVRTATDISQTSVLW